MLKAAGAEDIKIGREPLPEGWSIHEIGTARMGNDPKTSVTDRSAGCTTSERLSRGRESVRVGRHAEHDLVDPGDVLADDGLSEGTDEGRRCVRSRLHPDVGFSPARKRSTRPDRSCR